MEAATAEVMTGKVATGLVAKSLLEASIGLVAVVIGEAVMATGEVKAAICATAMGASQVVMGSTVTGAAEMATRSGAATGKAFFFLAVTGLAEDAAGSSKVATCEAATGASEAVSYTHLTLPTILLV